MENKRIVTSYRVGWLPLGNKKPTDVEVGCAWIFLIIFFPIWIWFYIIYKLTEAVGILLDNVKEEKEEVEEEEEKQTYY